MSLCSECKCCEAQEGFDLCIFCEDKVPCLNRQRIARPVAPAPAPAPIRVSTPGHRKPRNPNSPWRGFGSLQLNDKGPVDKRNEVQTAGKDLQEEKNNMAKQCACGCGQEVHPDSKWAYIKGHKPKPVKNKRLCACGCGTPLVNRHPYIKGHAPNQKKPRAKSHAPRTTATPPRKTVAKPVIGVSTPATGVATICVTEQHMDHFWSKLSLEEKANLFQMQLEGAQ